MNDNGTGGRVEGTPAYINIIIIILCERRVCVQCMAGDFDGPVVVLAVSNRIE